MAKSVSETHKLLYSSTYPPTYQPNASREEGRERIINVERELFFFDQEV